MTHNVRPAGSVPMHRDLAAFAADARARAAAPLPAIPASEARERIIAGNELCSFGPQIDEVEDVRILAGDSPVTVRLYRHGSASLGTLVYMHGGGWITGDLGYADEFLRFIARDTGLTVVSVDYRLAPEQPHPAPLVDAFTALLWASEKFASEGILAIGGDSAGGNLAAACAVRAAQERGPQLDLQVLIYPVLDHDFNRPSYKACATAFPLGRTDLVYCFDQYVPDVGLRPSPLVSPARLSDPSVLPPALIVVAGHDPLHDEGVAYASRLAEHEVPVTLLDYAELCHGFLRFTGAVEACGTARDEITAQIGQAVSLAARASRGKAISEAGQ